MKRRCDRNLGGASFLYRAAAGAGSAWAREAMPGGPGPRAGAVRCAERGAVILPDSAPFYVGDPYAVDGSAEGLRRARARCVWNFRHHSPKTYWCSPFKFPKICTEDSKRIVGELDDE